MLQQHKFAQILAIATLGTVLSACAMFEGRQTPGQYVDDATITARIKANIIAEPSLKVMQINVETMQGVVQLSGFVDSEAGIPFLLRTETKWDTRLRGCDAHKRVRFYSGLKQP